MMFSCKPGTSLASFGAILLALAGAAIALRMLRLPKDIQPFAAASFRGVFRHRRLCLEHLAGLVYVRDRPADISMSVLPRARRARMQAGSRPPCIRLRQGGGCLVLLILHIGTHKTGTSAVQECLYRNEMQARRAGHLLRASCSRQDPQSARATDCHRAGAAAPPLFGALPIWRRRVHRRDDAPDQRGVVLRHDDVLPQIGRRSLRGLLGGGGALHRAAARRAARRHANTPLWCFSPAGQVPNPFTRRR